MNNRTVHAPGLRPSFTADVVGVDLVSKAVGIKLNEGIIELKRATRLRKCLNISIDVIVKMSGL